MEGEIGVCVWLGAPSIHRMFGLNLAWHWQGCWGMCILGAILGLLGLGVVV